MPGIYKVITWKNAETVRRREETYIETHIARSERKCELQTSPIHLVKRDKTRQRGDGDVDDMSAAVRTSGRERPGHLFNRGDGGEWIKSTRSDVKSKCQAQ